MNLRRIFAALALLLVALPVQAQTTNPWPRFIPVRPDGTAIDPGAAGSGAATSANQTSEITALGGTGDTAYGGSGTASIIAALKGLYAINANRAAYFAEARAQAVSASGNFGGSIRDGGASPSLYAAFNISGVASQAGTILVYAYDSPAGGPSVQMVQQPVVANTAFSFRIANTWRAYQVIFVNGATAATLNLSTGFTAN